MKANRDEKWIGLWETNEGAPLLVHIVIGAPLLDQNKWEYSQKIGLKRK